jgi:hypothetical protein
MNSKLKRKTPVGQPRLVRLLAARFGYALIPISEIERMESDAESHYAAMQRKCYVTKSAKAYFNGVADHASKSAHRLREKYLPNTPDQERKSPASDGSKFNNPSKT